MTDRPASGELEDASPRRPRGLLVEVGAVATLAGGLRRADGQSDPALVPGPAAVAAWDGQVVAAGPLEEVRAAIERAGLPDDELERVVAPGRLVTPGLVDPHTHLLFAGQRADEWVRRQRGEGYLEILAAGGGILATVRATRAASAEALAAHGRRWLAEMLRRGVTTVEVKSGYGLDRPTELRLLEVARGLGREGPVDVVPTFLGLHAVPPEFLAGRSRPAAADAYVDHVIEAILPAVGAAGAIFCDAFCERGVFEADQCRRFLGAALGLGLPVRLHADELAPSGGAELAAELGARSADHLAAPSDAGIAALAAAAESGRPVVATLLPATTWFLRAERRAPARRLIELGVPVALGTDFNPGTSPTASLPLVLTIACLELGLSPAEALVAATVNAAHALGIADRVGSLEPGRQADLVVWRVGSVEELPYWVGADLAEVVVKRGRIVRRAP